METANLVTAQGRGKVIPLSSLKKHLEMLSSLSVRSHGRPRPVHSHQKTVSRTFYSHSRPSHPSNQFQFTTSFSFPLNPSINQPGSLKIHRHLEGEIFTSVLLFSSSISYFMSGFYVYAPSRTLKRVSGFLAVAISIL